MIKVSLSLVAVICIEKARTTVKTTTMTTATVYSPETTIKRGQQTGGKGGRRGMKVEICLLVARLCRPGDVPVKTARGTEREGGSLRRQTGGEGLALEYYGPRKPGWLHGPKIGVAGCVAGQEKVSLCWAQGVNIDKIMKGARNKWGGLGPSSSFTVSGSRASTRQWGRRL